MYFLFYKKICALGCPSDSICTFFLLIVPMTSSN